MASSSRGGGERMIHQDFIARIRYSNALPPPPNPPKLLDIPNTGLSSGQYTVPGFASRLAREQPLNIEADAELGMPLDLVGMPGVFDGDESSIQAPAHAPPVHPHDRLLLRPLSTLGKPKTADAAVSFLRRTEYISSMTVKGRPPTVDRSMFTGPQSRRVGPPDASKKRTAAAAEVEPEPDKGTPAYARRRIEKSFEVAQQDLADRTRVRHPTKRHLRLVDARPLLPDLDAFPDSGAYVTIKFLTNPAAGAPGGPPGSSVATTYDARIASGLFKPIERSREEDEAYELALELHERDPVNNPRPVNQMNYDFYLGTSADAARQFRRRFDVDDPGRYDDALYTEKSDSGPCFTFNRLRAYETATETELDHATKYDDELILSVGTATTAQDGTGEPAAFDVVHYYPVMQRSTIRPQRTKNIARSTIGGLAASMVDREGQIVDRLDVVVQDPTDEIREFMVRYREQPHGGFEAELQAQQSQGQEENEAGGADGGTETNGTRVRSAAGAGARDEDEDEDEGEDEDGRRATARSRRRSDASSQADGSDDRDADGEEDY